MRRRGACGRLALSLTAISLAAMATSPALAAQRWTPLSSLGPGDTVRVWATQPRLVGAVGLVDRLASDTLALADLPGRYALLGRGALPIPAITRLDVRRGYRRSGGRAAVGVVLGLAGGAVVGAAAGVLLECGASCSDENNEFAGLAGFVLGGGLGALAGAVTGGVLGARRRPHWQPVGLPRR